MGLSANIKPTKIASKVLFELSRLKDSQEFVDEFAQIYGSACEMWMNEEQMNDLSKLYHSQEYEFKCLSGESYDGSNDSAIESALNKGWKIFAEEQNGSSYDCILFKTKKSC